MPSRASPSVRIPSKDQITGRGGTRPHASPIGVLEEVEPVPYASPIGVLEEMKPVPYAINPLISFALG